MTDYPKRIAYIWQASEYQVGPFLKWWARITDFRSFIKRGDLVPTSAGRLVRAIIVGISGVYVVLNVLIIFANTSTLAIVVAKSLISIVLYPTAVVILSIPPVFALKTFVQKPRQKRLVASAKKIFEAHDGLIIAVAGSYGKTTMKELLAIVLGSEKKVAYTEGNKNVLTSIADFAHTLEGDEDILVVEFGEGAPGDVARMTDMVNPDYAVITGLAPNHLDRYKSLDEIADDFKNLAVHVGVERTFLNGDSPELFAHLGTMGMNYTKDGFDGWAVYEVKVAINYTSFELERCGEQIKLSSGLVGRHNIGPLVLAVSLALNMEVSKKAIQKAIEGLKPYEHRLEPKPMHGAWLVDDAYNGNIEGIEAGLAYLAEIVAEGKKIYVTSGLVDQGDQTETVHARIGQKIALAKPSSVYLMQNSVTDLIKKAMDEAGYSGDLKIIDEPLDFYNSIESIMAKGDVVLIQNDWPDSYN